MKLKSWIVAISGFLGIALFLLLSVNIEAVSLDEYVVGHRSGWSSNKDIPAAGLYYMDGSTTVGITLRESVDRDWNILSSVWYETASDVWRQPTADVTLKDSDADGYVDWIGFTATGGDTAGGEVRIYGVRVNTLSGI